MRMLSEKYTELETAWYSIIGKVTKYCKECVCVCPLLQVHEPHEAPPGAGEAEQ